MPRDRAGILKGPRLYEQFDECDRLKLLIEYRVQSGRRLDTLATVTGCYICPKFPFLREAFLFLVQKRPGIILEYLQHAFPSVVELDVKCGYHEHTRITHERNITMTS